MSRRKWIGAVAAFTLAFGAGVVAVASNPSVELAGEYGDGDGLNRFLVTLSPAGPSQVKAAGARLEGERQERRDIDLDALAKAKTAFPDGKVGVLNGRAHYYTDEVMIDVAPGSGGEVKETSAELGAAGTLEAQASEPPALKPQTPPEAAQDPSEAAADAVKFETPDAQAVEALQNRDGVVSVQLLHNNQVLVATSLEINEIKNFPEVKSVETSPMGEVFITEPNDPMYRTYGWNLRNTGNNAYQQSANAGSDIGAAYAWDVSQGQDTVIAVIDTGFDSDHPDLIGSLWNNPTEACGNTDTNKNGKAGDCHGWNFYTNSADIDNGTLGAHGTNVSGTAAARINNSEGSAGVAPKAQLMPLVIGGGNNVDMILASEAIRYAADNGADVINASFGGELGGSALTLMQDAVNYATSKGVLVVAASGNDGGNRDTSLVYPASLTNPGVITVGSTTALDTPSDTSAYGKNNVDIYAPGNRVFTTWNDGGYRLVSGTSIAAPHVSGAVALIRSINPNMSPAEIKAKIMAESTKLNALSSLSVSGGRLNVAKLSPSGSNGNETVAYTFSSMVAKPGTVTPRVKVASTASTGNYSVRFGLSMKFEGEIWAVSEKTLMLNGQSVTTNEFGEATFNLGSLPYLPSSELAPSVELGEGAYGLSVQVLKNGEPMSRPYAAPLNVQADAGAPGPGGTDPGTPNPGGTPTPKPSDPGSSNPGGTDPGTPNPGGSDPGTPNPGSTPTPKPSDPGGTEPGGSDPGTPNPGSTPTPKPSDSGGSNPGGTDPGTPDPGSTPKPSDPGGGTDPGGSNPGGSGPGTPNPGSTPTPKPSDPGAGSSPTPKPSDPTGDFKTYNKVGDFEITRISPTKVSVKGGDRVIVTGNAIDSGVSVRVGASGVGSSVSVLGGTLSFTTPSLVAGTYNVTIYKNGKTSVLTDALTFSGTQPPDVTDPGSTPKPSDPGGGTDPGGSNPGGSGPGTPNPGSTPTPKPGTPGPGSTPKPSDPGGSNPGGSGPGTPNPGGTPTPKPSDPGGGSTPQDPNARKTGPNGEKLVRNDSLKSLQGLWGIDCSNTCTGLQA